jgi:hypothetical protein
VFDEVDAGIGGRAADPVGRSLWALARSHQVLVVTHLPQIAAHADAHFRIAKRERDGRTITEIERLDREGRIVELAAMLGGSASAAPFGGERSRDGSGHEGGLLRSARPAATMTSPWTRRGVARRPVADAVAPAGSSARRGSPTPR